MRKESNVRIKIAYYERKAYRAMQQDIWDQAEKYLRLLLDMNESNMGFRYNLGVCLLAQKKFEEAEQLFLGNVERYGESLRTCRVLGDLYYEWNDREQALEWYQKAIEDNPDRREKKLLRSRISICESPEKFDRVSQAFSLAEEARKLKSTQPEKSLELYKRAAKADPTHVEALNAVGGLLLEHYKEPESALKYLRQVDKLVNSEHLQLQIQRIEKKK
jgi:tetratricopeptide (TPR) repeat protein